MRMGPRGPVMDTQTMAEEITDAVNAALDDLRDKIRKNADPIDDRLSADLNRAAEGFERALGEIAGDLARAQQRLQR